MFKKFLIQVYRYFKSLLKIAPGGIVPPGNIVITPLPGTDFIPIAPGPKFDAYKSFYEIAEKELGQKEDFFGENPKIIEYHDATTLSANRDEVPWCASFVNWVLFIFLMRYFWPSFREFIQKIPANIRRNLVDVITTRGNEVQIVNADYDPDWLPTFSAGAHSFLTWGYKLKTPVKGCIVVMRRLPNPDTDRHVGIFDHISGSHIYLLGGNQGNAVNIRAHRLDWVLEYRGFYPEA